MNPRSQFDAENLLTLVQRMREQRSAPPKLKVTAKTLEIHAPDRVVAFLAKLVQLDAAKLHSGPGKDANGSGADLERRFEWLERLLAGAATEKLAEPGQYRYVEMASLRDTATRAMAGAEATGVDKAMLELELGCLVAYFELTPPKKQMETSADLVGVLPMVAIALSTVATIWRHGADPAQLVTTPDLRNRLFARTADGAHVAELDGLAIRRRDLRYAIDVLKEARMTFGSRR